jgi:hypothetical protein
VHVHQVDAELSAGEVEAPRLVPRTVVDVELGHHAPGGHERAQPAPHGHEVFGEAPARLGEVARAVVDEGAQLRPADLAGAGADVGTVVEITDDESERVREAVDQRGPELAPDYLGGPDDPGRARRLRWSELWKRVWRDDVLSAPPRCLMA